MRKTNLSSFSLLLCLSISSLLSPPCTATTTPSGTIHRTTNQLILATISADEPHSQPFLTSLSGKYTTSLIRASSSCYIQLQDTSSGHSLWMSVCASIANTATCSLLFSDTGLEVSDGSQSIWKASTEGAPSITLELVDDGDLRIFNADWIIAWESSNEPVATQGCDSTLETTPVSAPPLPDVVVPETSPPVVTPPESELVPDNFPVVVVPPAPELVPETSPVVVTPPAAPELVPDASPVVVTPPAAPELVPETSPVINAPPSPGLYGGSGSPLSSSSSSSSTGGSNGGVGLPFGKPVQGGGLSSVNGPVGLGDGQELGQPLVDNTPYDSGCWIGRESWFGVVSGLALALCFFMLSF